MDIEKTPDEECIHPVAPTELLGETNDLLLDLVHYFMQNEVDDLVALGVHVEWIKESDDEPAHYQFTADETRLARIAKAAYHLGKTERDAHAYREYLDELLDNYSNNQKSVRVREQDRLNKVDQAILLLAEKLKTGDVSAKALAGELGVSLQTVYRRLGEFRDELLKAASPFVAQNPSASLKEIEDWLVERFEESTPWVTRLTIRKVLKGKRLPRG